MEGTVKWHFSLLAGFYSLVFLLFLLVLSDFIYLKVRRHGYNDSMTMLSYVPLYSVFASAHWFYDPHQGFVDVNVVFISGGCNLAEFS